MFCQAPFALYLIKVPFGTASRCSKPFCDVLRDALLSTGVAFSPQTHQIMTVCQASRVSGWCNRYLWSITFIKILLSFLEVVCFKVITPPCNISWLWIAHLMVDDVFNYVLYKRLYFLFSIWISKISITLILFIKHIFNFGSYSILWNWKLNEWKVKKSTDYILIQG